MAARLKQELDSAKGREQRQIWMHASPKEVAQELQSLRTRCHMLDRQLSEVRRQLREERALKRSVPWVAPTHMTRPSSFNSLQQKPLGVH
jgi:ppGpp synthetase/RelA/SpoT-type nucleotidyltranferase